MKYLLCMCAALLKLYVQKCGWCRNCESEYKTSYTFFQTKRLPVQQRTLLLIDDEFIQGDVNCLEDLYLGCWYLFSLT